MSRTIVKQMTALAQKNQRSTELIAEFSGGFAVGWTMAVRECFRSQMDIKFTARTENQPAPAGQESKKQVKFWTQGPRIAFDAGHVFFDTPLAYAKWDNAMQHIQLACSILEAAPNEVRKKGQAPMGGNALIEGYVLIELFVPNRNKTRLISKGKLKLSQNDFLDFLMTGKLNRAGEL